MVKTFAEYDIEDLVYGERWSLSMTHKESDGTPIPLTNKRLYGEFREGKDRTGRLVIKMDSNESTIEVTNEAQGEFELRLSSEQALLFSKSKGVWDLWIIEGTEKDLLIKGKWQSSEAATDWSSFT